MDRIFRPHQSVKQCEFLRSSGSQRKPAIIPSKGAIALKGEIGENADVRFPAERTHGERVRFFLNPGADLAF